MTYAAGYIVGHGYMPVAVPMPPAVRGDGYDSEMVVINAAGRVVFVEMRRLVLPEDQAYPADAAKWSIAVFRARVLAEAADPMGKWFVKVSGKGNSVIRWHRVVRYQRGWESGGCACSSSLDGGLLSVDKPEGAVVCSAIRNRKS